MEPEAKPAIRSRLQACWQSALLHAARVPAKGWIVFGFFLFAAALMALHTALGGKDSVLRLKVQHAFRSAQLTVWIDGSQVYSGRLIGSTRKRFGLIPEAAGGSLSETLSVSSGNHQVRVRVAPDDGSVQEDTIAGEFASQSQRTLSVSARRSDVSLAWSDSLPVAAAGAAEAQAPPPTGWLERYAGTLLLTAAGSIISALTGYALKELPRQLASRQGEAPKA